MISTLEAGVAILLPVSPLSALSLLQPLLPAGFPLLVIVPGEAEAPERIATNFNIIYSPLSLDELPLGLVSGNLNPAPIHPHACTQSARRAPRGWAANTASLYPAQQHTTQFFETLIISVSYLTVPSL